MTNYLLPFSFCCVNSQLWSSYLLWKEAVKRMEWHHQLKIATSNGPLTCMIPLWRRYAIQLVAVISGGPNPARRRRTNRRRSRRGSLRKITRILYRVPLWCRFLITGISILLLFLSSQSIGVQYFADLWTLNFVRLKGVSTTGGQSSVDNSGKHEAMIMDYSMSNQEAKCGSSFLRESVAKMHFSTAEASWEAPRFCRCTLNYVNMMNVYK